MKKIVFEKDGAVSIMEPQECARLATEVTLPSGDKIKRDSGSVRVDKLVRPWPKPGVVPTWAETEIEFTKRIAESDVPVKLVVPYTDPYSGTTVDYVPRGWAIKNKLQFTETAYQIIDDVNIPTKDIFRNGLAVLPGRVEHDLLKCKTIAHDKRRTSRAKQFAPLDIEATIPAKAAQAETKRQAIRDKDATIQSQIDAASDVSTLKTIVGSLA